MKETAVGCDVHCVFLPSQWQLVKCVCMMVYLYHYTGYEIIVSLTVSCRMEYVCREDDEVTLNLRVWGEGAETG